MILAVLIAPILAVQVQKCLGKMRDDKERKLSIFKTLMATRGRALDSRHVEALNMIDLEFYGVISVVDEWKAYLDHLINMPRYPETGKLGNGQESVLSEYSAKLSTWADKREDLLANLLFEMGQSVGYKFDKTHIKRSIYSPQGHADLEDQQYTLRQALIALTSGQKALNVSLTQKPNENG